MAEANWPTVFESNNEFEANLALGFLRDNGVRAVLITSESVLYVSGVSAGRFRIKVSPEQAAGAAALLEKTHNEKK